MLKSFISHGQDHLQEILKEIDLMDKRYDVVISGASASGLALALALSRASGGSLRIGVVEKTTSSLAEHPNFPAFAISAGSRHMMEALGVWNELSSQAQKVERIEITDSSLEDSIRPIFLRYNNITFDGEPATHIVQGDVLITTLRRSIQNHTAIDFLFEKEITSFSAQGLYADIHFKSGEIVQTKVLISAEGRQSILREMVGIQTIGWSYNQTGIVVTVAHERPHEGIAVQHFLPGGPFAILPLVGQRSCVTWSENELEAKRILALEEEGFVLELEKRFGRKLGEVQLLSDRKFWPLSLQLARSYVAERFALVGDSAHAVHPIAGQGLNLAFRDCAALAEVIMDALRIGLDFGDKENLSRYERWRRFDVSTSTFLYDSLNRLFSTDNTFLRILRDAGLGFVDRLPTIKQYFVDEAAGLTGKVPRLLQGNSI